MVGSRRVSGAETADRVPAFGRGFDDDDIFEAQCPQPQVRADTDRSRAEDHRAVTRLRGGPGHRVVRDGHRFDQRALHVADLVGQPERHALGDDGVLRETSA